MTGKAAVVTATVTVNSRQEPTGDLRSRRVGTWRAGGTPGKTVEGRLYFVWLTTWIGAVAPMTLLRPESLAR